MSRLPTSYSKRSALALRFHFLFEAFHLDLLPPALAKTVLRLSAAVREGADVLSCAKTVESAFLDLGERLRLRDLAWPEVSDRSVVWAARAALPRVEGEVAFRPAAERLGRFCEDLANRGRQRRQSGSYYTPSWAADAIALTVVQGVLAGRGRGPEAAASLKALDPAVGAGAFAIAVVEAIAGAAGEGEEQNEVRRRAAEECLSAIEMDPLAAEACRLSVWLAASRPGRPAALPACRLQVGDALARPPDRSGFDLVVGNPPWGVKLHPARAKRLAQGAPRALSGHRDSHLFFLHLAAEAARDDGAIGLLLPDALLWQVRYEELRRALLDRFRPLRVALLGDRIFARATAPSAILCLAGRGISPRSFPTADLRTTARARLPGVVARRGWLASRDDPLEAAHHTFLLAPGWLRRLLDHLLARHPTLGDLGERFTFRDVGINYPRAHLGRAILYEGRREHRRDLPVVRGRDFGPLTPIGRSAWLRHDWRTRVGPEEGVSVREEVYRQAPKLLLRQTGDRPIATIDRRGVYFGRSVIAITAQGERDLLWLAALLNSGVFAALYRALAPEAGRPFAQVKVSKLQALPLPAAREEALAELAERTLAQTDQDLRRGLLDEIDREAARAYDLSRADARRVAAWV